MNNMNYLFVKDSFNSQRQKQIAEFYSPLLFKYDLYFNEI